ncbi:MAG TPA: flagellar hook assembly protein FlgD [Gammaproteobacteria bacterium]|nr:flagellar hook assembly protein FlgD [Gammaproteobacteria bacterium]
MIDTGNTLQGPSFRSIQELNKEDTRKELGQEDFLKLMTTQLQNQDPMKPMENGDFLSQIAQFSTVTGIGDLQKSFESLSESLVSNQALQAATLVGRKVLAPTGTAALAQGGSIQGSVELPSASSSVVVNIYDGAGQVIRRLDLGSQAAGPVSFQWDGLMDDGQYAPPGNYLVGAEAGFDGRTEAIETLIASEVRSVTVGNGGGLLLDLAGSGPLEFSQVRQIL